MEEISNGKIEETEKFEIEENGTEDAEQPKENCEPVKESVCAEEMESFLMQVLEESEKGKEEEEVINIVDDFDEHVVETSMETQEEIGETEIESKGMDETELEPKGNDDTDFESKGADGMRETASYNPEGLSEAEDKNSAYLVDKDEQSASAIAVEVAEENALNETENSQVVTREIGNEDIQVEEKASAIVDSLKPTPNAVIVGSNDAFPETAQNPHVISVSQRTSWKSCCGLLQVLRRSNS